MAHTPSKHDDLSAPLFAPRSEPRRNSGAHLGLHDSPSSYRPRLSSPARRYPDEYAHDAPSTPGYDSYRPAYSEPGYDSYRGDVPFYDDYYVPPAQENGNEWDSDPWSSSAPYSAGGASSGGGTGGSSSNGSWSDRRRPEKRNVNTDRMFEPSTAWKQTHGEDGSSHGTDRGPGSRWEANDRYRGDRHDYWSPRTASYSHHNDFPSRGDNYRPMYNEPRNGLSAGSDSYRPAYADTNHWSPKYGREADLSVPATAHRDSWPSGDHYRPGPSGVVPEERRRSSFALDEPPRKKHKSSSPHSVSSMSQSGRRVSESPAVHALPSKPQLSSSPSISVRQRSSPASTIHPPSNVVVTTPKIITTPTTTLLRPNPQNNQNGLNIPAASLSAGTNNSGVTRPNAGALQSTLPSKPAVALPGAPPLATTPQASKKAPDTPVPRVPTATPLGNGVSSINTNVNIVRDSSASTKPSPITREGSSGLNASLDTTAKTEAVSSIISNRPLNSPIELKPNLVTTVSSSTTPAVATGPPKAATTTAPTSASSTGTGAGAGVTSATEGIPSAKTEPKPIPAPTVSFEPPPAPSVQVARPADNAPPPTAVRKESIVPSPVTAKQASVSSVASAPGQSGGEQELRQQQQPPPPQQQQEQQQSTAPPPTDNTTVVDQDKPKKAAVPPPPIPAHMPTSTSTSTSASTSKPVSTSEKSKPVDPTPTTSTTADADANATVPPPVAASIQPVPTHVSSPTSSIDLSQATSMAEALRVVIMHRARCDRQSREERVEPILAANLALMQASEKYEENRDLAIKVKEEENEEAKVPADASSSSKTPAEKLLAVHGMIRWHLRERIEDRQTEKQAKAEQLMEEYKTLNEAWKAHCAKLDAAAQTAVANPSDESGAAVAAAAAAANGSGRVTRYSRSTAVLGDAVASDLDFERLLKRLEHSEATDPNILAKRNLAKIPDMISVTHGRLDYVYDDTNNLVTDPSIYEPQTGIDDWTEQEKLAFMERYAAYPKQFGLIAEGLPHKTARQCVAFYYLHKKRMIDFRKVIVQFAPRRRGGRRKVVDKPQGGLLADILKHDAEVSAQYGVGLRRRRAPAHAPTPVATEPRRRRRGAAAAATATAPQSRDDTSTPEPDGRTKVKRPPVSRTLTANTSVEMEVDSVVPVASTSAAAVVTATTTVAAPRPIIKRARKGRKPTPKTPYIVPAEDEGAASPDGSTAASTPAPPASMGPTTPSGIETRFIDQTEATIRKKAAAANVPWSEEDKVFFLKLLSQHGDDFKRISASMPNKTTIQVSNFFNSNLKEFRSVADGAPKRSPSLDPDYGQLTIQHETGQAKAKPTS